jgi:homoserine dehydrogenase
LADITGVLGRNRISIASVIQHEPQEDRGAGPEAEAHGQVVPLVMMTHTASEGAASRAVEEIDNLSCVRQPSVRMRVAL